MTVTQTVNLDCSFPWLFIHLMCQSISTFISHLNFSNSKESNDSFMTKSELQLPFKPLAFAHFGWAQLIHPYTAVSQLGYQISLASFNEELSSVCNHVNFWFFAFFMQSPFS